MFPKPFDNWGKHVNCYPRLVPIIKKNTNDSPDTNMLNMHDIAAYLMYIFLYSKFLSLYIDDIIYNVYIYICIYDKYIYIPCICMASISSTPEPPKPKPGRRASPTGRSRVVTSSPFRGRPVMAGTRAYLGGARGEMAIRLLPGYPKQPVFLMDGNGDFQPLFTS